MVFHNHIFWTTWETGKKVANEEKRGETPCTCYNIKFYIRIYFQARPVQFLFSIGTFTIIIIIRIFFYDNFNTYVIRIHDVYTVKSIAVVIKIAIRQV